MKTACKIDLKLSRSDDDSAVKISQRQKFDFGRVEVRYLVITA